LGIDTILYPQEKVYTPRQKADYSIEGLRGYTAAGKRVYKVMN